MKRRRGLHCESSLGARASRSPEEWALYRLRVQNVLLTLPDDSAVTPVVVTAAGDAAAGSSAQKIRDPYGFAERIDALERVHTERLDMHVERLERLERPVDSRDAITWEIGHAAGLRGEPATANPFRKAGR